MKIVFVVPDMIGGGTERIVSLLANEYVKRGIEAAVLIFAGNKLEYSLDERVEVVMAGGPSGGNPWIRLKRIRFMREYYRKNRDCAIFAFSVMGAVFSAVATIGEKHWTLVSERSNPNEYEHKWIRDFFYGRADRVVLQTDDVLKSFGRKIREKAVVIPNPVDPMLPPAYKGKRKKKICAAARLEPSKDHKTLLRAFYDFQKEFGDYTLEIYGKGSMEWELNDMTKEMGMDENVNFHCFCPTVREEIRDHAMYILSSKFEGISNALMETLAMGMPVIATDCPVGGSRMCIKDHENGILVPVEDPKALAAAMKELASDEELSQKLARNAEELRERFAIERIAEQFLGCMEEERCVSC